MGVIGGAGEGQAREERGRRELGGGHLAGAFGRVRKAEVRPDEEARWQGQAVCPEARGGHYSFPIGCHFKQRVTDLPGMRLNRELIKYGFPAPPPDILP